MSFNRPSTCFAAQSRSAMSKRKMTDAHLPVGECITQVCVRLTYSHNYLHAHEQLVGRHGVFYFIIDVSL